MKYFRKNIFRSALKNKGTYAGAVLIIALGIFIYIAMIDTLNNLKAQVDEYYLKNNMADIFANVIYMPKSELAELENIPGIAQASGILSADVRIVAEDMDSIISLHLLGYDKESKLNQIRIEGGSSLNETEIFIGKKMMKARGWQPGQKINLILEGKSYEFTIAGNAYAPNYIYTIPPSGSFISDGSDYDMAVIAADRLGDILGKNSNINEIGFRLERGYTYEDLRLILSDRLRPYGLKTIYSREEQTSFRMVQGELEELIATGTLLPVIFIAMSVFMLYTVLKKIVDKDRKIIGTMKALGMKNHELILPYLFQAMLIGFLGSILGSLMAGYFGQYMFNMYLDFFTLPGGTYRDFLSSRIFAVIIALLASIFAVFHGVKGIVNIVPAEAMRAASPKALMQFDFFDVFLEKLKTMEKIGVRSVSRSLTRTFLIALAIAFPFSMSSVLFSYDDVVDNLIIGQFEKDQLYDLKIALEKFTSKERAEGALIGIEGIAESESYCELPVILQYRNHSEYAVLSGLNKGSLMYKIYDSDEKYYDPPKDGVIINIRIADKLGAKEGDIIEIGSGYDPDRNSKVRIKKIIREDFGNGCYIDIQSVRNYLDMEAPVNTILINIEKDELDNVKKFLMNASGIFSISATKDIIRAYVDIMDSMLFMMNTFIAMTVVVGSILIYNISMISIRDRKTEFATLMIMGIKNEEIGRIIFAEQCIYMLFGLVIGFPMAQVWKKMLDAMMQSETYMISININARSYIEAFILCLFILIMSSYSILRSIYKIKPTDSLKERA